MIVCKARISKNGICLKAKKVCASYKSSWILLNLRLTQSIYQKWFLDQKFEQRLSDLDMLACDSYHPLIAEILAIWPSPKPFKTSSGFNLRRKGSRYSESWYQCLDWIPARPEMYLLYSLSCMLACCLLLSIRNAISIWATSWVWSDARNELFREGLKCFWRAEADLYLRMPRESEQI